MDELEGFQRKVSLERKELERIFTGKKKKKERLKTYFMWFGGASGGKKITF